MPSTAVNAIRIVLCSNKRLKKLEFHDDSLFSEDFSTTISCKLKEFNFVALDCKSQHNRQNLNLFLISQRDTLEILEVNGWAGIEVKETVLLLPRLKKLTFGENFASSLTQASEVLTQNRTVTTLTLLNSLNLAYLCFNIILPAFRKLESLEISSMPNDVADMIAESCKCLKRLFVRFYCVTNIKEPNVAFYLNLEEFRCNYVAPTASIPLLERLGGRT